MEGGNKTAGTPLAGEGKDKATDTPQAKRVVRSHRRKSFHKLGPHARRLIRREDTGTPQAGEGREVLKEGVAPQAETERLGRRTRTPHKLGRVWKC